MNENKRGWQEAILKKLTDMEVKRKILVKAKLKSFPENRKLIESIWVLKRMKNRFFCASLCALGYSQVPRVVVNDITLLLVLFKWLMNPTWETEVYDVETAFVCRELEEPIYIKIPKGMG